MLIRKFDIPNILWSPQEEALMTDLVHKTLIHAHDKNITQALSLATRELGFSSFVFGLVANDVRPGHESRAYVLTDQSEDWVHIYEQQALLEHDPRIELASEPGYVFWQGSQFQKNPRYAPFISKAEAHGIRSGLVVGLCSRDPPCYAMLAMNSCRPTLDDWSPETRMMAASQASLLGRIISRSVRQYLYSKKQVFPAPTMALNNREKELLILVAAGKTSKEIAELLNIAKITVDIHIGKIMTKMGVLNRNQAVVKAIANGLIQMPDVSEAEHKSAAIQDIRSRPKKK
jgi:DNA-binding CsgD family transcriptional regulator